MYNTARLLAAACIAVIAALAGPTVAHGADHPDLFQLTSPDFTDNGMLSAANAATGSSTRGPWACGGQNVSPALSWSHAPAGTKSFAVTMDDPDAASGIGANHWIAYDIPATTTALPRDAGGGSSHLLVGGANGRKVTTYTGPCAEPGAKQHHFLWMIYALDIPPGTLAPGLSREEFMRQIRGHNLAEASLSSRYEQRPAKAGVLSHSLM